MLSPEPMTKTTKRKARSNGKDIYQGEITPLVNHPQWRFRSAAAGFFALSEPNSADIFVLGSPSLAIEVKTAHEGVFSFISENGWREGQQQWAEEFQRDTGCRYWLAVIFETPLTRWTTMLRKTSGKGKLPRAAFLVPYERAVTVRDLLPQGSLPYKVQKGMLLEMQANHYDACTLWADLELHWEGHWTVPVSHPFYDAYLTPPGLKENKADVCCLR